MDLVSDRLIAMKVKCPIAARPMYGTNSSQRSILVFLCFLVVIVYLRLTTFSDIDTTPRSSPIHHNTPLYHGNSFQAEAKGSTGEFPSAQQHPEQTPTYDNLSASAAGPSSDQGTTKAVQKVAPMSINEDDQVETNTTGKAAEDDISEDKGRNLKRRFPNCIIFGVSKSGTRAVMEFLKLHPDVVGPIHEVSYFDHPEKQKNLGIGWYLRQMPPSYPHQITLEKSPDYFQNYDAPRLLHQLSRTVKLIVIFRDPVVRLVSQYMQLKDKSGPRFPPFEQWAVDKRTGEVNAKLSSVKVGLYCQHLARWYSFFPPSQIHILESSAFTKNPYKEMKDLERFLNIKPFFTEKDLYFDTGKGFHCIAPREGTKHARCLSADKGREHDAVDSTILEKLYKFYEPYNECLSRTVNRTFPWKQE